MELFTYVTMGGTEERMVIDQIATDAASKLKWFDASKAMCFLPSDRDKLLAIIEAAFGDLKPFSVQVRSLLSHAQRVSTMFVPRGLTAKRRGRDSWQPKMDVEMDELTV